MEHLMQLAQRAYQDGDLDEAAGTLQQLVGLSPRNHGAWYTLALVELRRGRADVAIAAMERAVALDRRNADYHNAYGAALTEAGAWDEAEKRFRQAIKVRPTLTDGHFNLGKLAEKQGRLDDAAKAYERARRIDPRRADARESLGRVLLRAGKVAQAHREYLDFHRDLPDNSDAAACLALTTTFVDGPAVAQAFYRRAMQQFPQNERLHWDFARFLLSIGCFAEGFRESVWRPTGLNRPPLPQRGDLKERSVLLEQEQGIGDVLFFCRFAREFRQPGMRLALRCEAKLAPIIAGLGLFDQVFSDPEEARSVGAEITGFVGDLPAILGTDAAAPSARFEAHRAAAWRERLAALGPAPHVAITWRAGTDNSRMPEFTRAFNSLYKEAPMEQLGRVLRDMPGTLVAIQRQPQAGEIAAVAAAAGRTVHDLTALNEDLEEMCGLLRAVDEYVGVSNTNMHLMAAVGGTARVLVPFAPEWRWMLEGRASPWFPGFAVYRQTAEKDWAPAMAQLTRDLLERRHA